MAAIEDYAIIGDCETAALVARDGSIDWLCWPTFASDACFAALIGTPKNGRWRIAPAGKSTVTRNYRGHTLILETHFKTGDGEVTVTDFMPLGVSSDVVRIVRGESGRVRLEMELIVRFGMGAHAPWVRRIRDGNGVFLEAICGPDMAVLRSPVDTRGENLTTRAEFDVGAGEELAFVLSFGPSHLPRPKPLDVAEALESTTRFWNKWCGNCNYDGEHRDMVLRSLITLKALTYAPTGGIVAAPTTSLPETLGGRRNWDYRFCWLRDATFTLLALMNSGYQEEALAWHNWLLRSVAGSPSDIQIMYGISGERRLTEWEAPWLDGYEGAKPVRIGNDAYAQLQLDVFGELMDVFHQARVNKLKFDDGSWAVECALLQHLKEIWRLPDSGIWEHRAKPRHYVTSKMMCWVAFDRGIKTVEKFGLKAPIDEWRATRDAIHAEVCEKGYNRGQKSFVVAYGSKLLDASILMMPAVGFLDIHDERVQNTVRAVEKHLVHKGLVLRHDPRGSRRRKPIEGAFLSCTLWLADAYVLSGEHDKAQKLFDRILGVANDLGLLSEEYDTDAGRLTGNFPQALTHIALINTAHNLSVARKPARQRAKE